MNLINLQKRIKLLLFLLLIFFISCGGIKKVSINKLSNKDGVFYVKGKPYNGRTVEYYEKDKPKEERYYKKGKLYKVLEWNQKGKLKEERELWIYEYGAYVKNNKNVFLATGSSNILNPAIKRDTADQEARVKLSHILRFYSKSLYKIYAKSVKNEKLTDQELKNSFKIIVDNELLPDPTKEDTVVLSFVGSSNMESYKNQLYLQVMSKVSDINDNIMKLNLDENFKKILNKNSEKAHLIVKYKWDNYLDQKKKNRKKTIDKIKILMNEQGIDEYKLELYFNGDKKKLISKDENITKILSWYLNGKKQEKLRYRNKKLSGKAIKWNEKGVKILDANYTNDKLHGLVTKWDKNGKKIEELNYKNGTLHGKQTKWFSNGNIKEKSSYLYGKLNDKFMSYHENGKKSVEITYSVGKKDGFYLSYHKNGNIKEEYFADKGKVDGDYKSYYDNNQKKVIGKYIEGKREGLFVKYHKNGKIAKKLRYKDGLPVATLKRWHDNGKKAESGRYVNFLKSGWFTTYYKNGKIEEKIKYKNEKIIGNLIKYHKNGKKAESTTYKNGIKDGKYTKWYSNGKKAESGKFKNGLKYGTFLYWDKEGNVKTVFFKNGRY